MFVGLDYKSVLSLSGLYGLTVLIPRPCRDRAQTADTGRSGWWVLVGIIPLFGLIALIFFTCQDSQPGWNIYGDNPKGVEF